MLIPPSELVAVAKATITECTVKQAHECLNADTVLLDIREPMEFRKSHIPGALHLPRGLLEFDIHDLLARACADDDNRAMHERPIVVYCGTGGRSALAAQSLQAMGYVNVRSMAGGIVAWTAAQLPVATPD